MGCLTLRLVAVRRHPIQPRTPSRKSVQFASKSFPHPCLSVFATAARSPWLKNGLIWLQIGFEMALFGFKWVCFYRQNRHFTSVKSGDSCIFKMALFRNFDVLSPEPPGGRSAGHRPGKLMLCISGRWSLDAWSFSPLARGGSPLNSRALQSFTKLDRRLGGRQGRVLSRRSRTKADATLLACAAGTLWHGHPAPPSARCNSSF